MKYEELKARHQEEISMLNKEMGLFWAFSIDQFNEGKKLNPSKKYVSIGMGGYLPKANADKWFKRYEELNKLHNKEIKEAREAKEEAILYELSNYECFYTGNIHDVIELFEGIYTREEIKKVYLKNRVKYQANL
jgi:hypothetical protein